MAVGLSWISLDSLVRIETYQWVMGEIARKFFPPVSLALRGEKGETAVEAMRKSRLFMGLAYSCFRFSATDCYFARYLWPSTAVGRRGNGDRLERGKHDNSQDTGEIFFSVGSCSSQAN